MADHPEPADRDESPCRCGRDRYSDDGECAGCDLLLAYVDHDYLPQPRNYEPEHLVRESQTAFAAAIAEIQELAEQWKRLADDDIDPGAEVTFRYCAEEINSILERHGCG